MVIPLSLDSPQLLRESFACSDSVIIYIRPPSVVIDPAADVLIFEAAGTSYLHQPLAKNRSGAGAQI
jgi:hypothetical protein